MKFVGRLAQWLLQPSGPSRSPRYVQPGLVAYYWAGSVSLPHEIRDISVTGAYLCTTEPWHAGTLIHSTFSRNRAEDQNAPAEFIVITCEVVRRDADGLGVRFIPPDRKTRRVLNDFIRGKPV
jgi:PilZ domain-containing protein